jgi:hypothetical protein
MGWTIPAGRPDVVLHYSEDAAIRAFVPHVPRSNPTASAAVWAIDPAHAALYWFPRDCPRVAIWANDRDEQELLRRQFSTDATRLHIAPTAWRDAIRECRLFEYRFDPTPFAPWPDAEGQWVAHERVVPESVEPVGDLVARHAAADVELRFVDDLQPPRVAALNSGLPFSIVRFRPA